MALDIISYAKIGNINKKVDGITSGVESVSVDNENSRLTFNFANGTTSTMTFPKPNNGISITGVEIDSSNHLIITYSDNSTSDAGLIETIKGDKGDTGIVPHIDDETKRWFIGDQDTGYVAAPNTDISFNDLSDIPIIPVAVSQLSNDENFIKRTVSNLINYLPKDDIYSKDEVNNLISNINRLTTLIVNELPTTDISTSTIYLIAAEGSIYNQHMYINGEWANLGNTSVNLDEYVTAAQLQLALNTKSDINHTHEELHAHSNFPLLETITVELIQKWNSKFSGNYNDLTNKPSIPVVTNDLTNALKTLYDNAAEKSHEHNGNLPVLNKFSEGVDGKPLYNNSPIGGEGGGGSGTVQSVNKILPDNDGDVQLVASDIDTYTKTEIENKIGNVLNIQYIKSPLDGLEVKSAKEIFSSESYPIANKNMVIFEDENTIRFIVGAAEASLYRIYIRTMNKNTYEFTDEDTGNTYSAASNNVGYSRLFVDETYCYFSKTGSSTNGTIPVTFYRLNYTVPNSTLETRSSFPQTWRGTVFVKVNSVVYGFGGASSWAWSDNRDVIWKYNIATNVWTVLSAKIPTIISNASITLSKDKSKIYASFGYQSNVSSQWSQKHAWYFDIATETAVALPDRSVDALSGLQYKIDIGYVAIPTMWTNNSTYTWGELGSQVYVSEINQWVNFNSKLPIKAGTGTTTDESSFTIIDIKENTVHLRLDGVSYYLALSFKTLGLFSKNESVYITAYTKATKDVTDINGNIILEGTAIPSNTEINILEDDTRLYLLTNIATDGSWIRRPPTRILGAIEETTLWEGSAVFTVTDNTLTSDSTELILQDVVSNYDEIQIEYCWHRTSNSLDAYHKKNNYIAKDMVISSDGSVGAITLNIQHNYYIGIAGALKSNNTIRILSKYGRSLSGNTNGNALKIYRITGIKHKTFE